MRTTDFIVNDLEYLKSFEESSEEEEYNSENVLAPKRKKQHSITSDSEVYTF